MTVFACNCLVFILLLSPWSSSVGLNINQKLAKLFDRNDLICPITCEDTHEDPYYEDDMECCTCLAQPFWINSTYSVMLNLEFVDSDIPVIMPKLSPDNTSISSVIYKHGNLSITPINICNISGIVYIDFTNNSISNISAFSCVVDLDTLILKYNRIESLPETIFRGLKYLRVLDLSHNKLKYIEPKFTFNMDGSLFHFDVSYNNLTSIDITNTIWSKQKYFCVANFSHNSIIKFSNLPNWHVNTSNPRLLGRGGYNDLTYNNFTEFVNFSEIGFTDITTIGIIFRYSYDVRYNNWNCDCRFYPVISKSALAVGILGADHQHLRCNAPPELKGKYIRNFTKESDLLICNITLKDKCPPNCHCFYQPSQNRTVVNCRSVLVSHKLPLVLPDDRNLVVDFSENSISDLEKEFTPLLLRPNKDYNNYTMRIKEVNLAKNNIKQLPDFVVQSLKNATMVNFSGNRLSSIPESVKMFHPCHIMLGLIFMKCTCKDRWLKTWIPSNTAPCFNNTQVFCRTEEDTKFIVDVDLNDLGCDKDTQLSKWIAIGLGSLLIIVSFISTLCYNFRIDLYMIFRKCSRKSKSASLYRYDVYISCNEEDDHLRQWVSQSLDTCLRQNGFRVFVPYRDCQLGTSREEDINRIITDTRTVIIILSENYPDHLKSWISHEWKYAWINYKKDLRKNIIVINYDMLKTSDVSNNFIKAFIRLGRFLDFKNCAKNLEQSVVSLIGNPCSKFSHELTNQSEQTYL